MNEKVNDGNESHDNTGFLKMMFYKYDNDNASDSLH